jgi:hypothetical protein
MCHTAGSVDSCRNPSLVDAGAVQQPSLLTRAQEILGGRRLRFDQDRIELVEERLGRHCWWMSSGSQV